MKNVPNFLIGSAYSSELPLIENLQRHSKLKRLLKDAGMLYLEVLGSYKGTQEESVLIPMTAESPHSVQLSNIFFETFKQDAILIVSDGWASIITSNGLMCSLGKLQEYNQLDNQPNWTKINDTYYTTE